jgi:hypothetical protein
MDDGKHELVIVVFFRWIIQQLWRRIVGRWGRIRPVVKGTAVMAAVLGLSCSFTPAGRERAHAYETLRAMPEVADVTIGCEGAIFASDSLCADVITKEGKSLRFERVGFASFGSNAKNVVVGEADGLVLRVASCTTVEMPNFQGDAALGHHLQPPLIDLEEAISRVGELLEEINYWPRCPMSWEVQDKRGVNYRYCARKKDDNTDPPRPPGC